MIRLNIDLFELKKDEISVNELLLLVKLKYPEVDFSFTPMIYRAALKKELFFRDKHGEKLTKDGSALVKKYSSSVEDVVTPLAKALRELFPPGKKGGNYYWRGSESEIVTKLTVFFNKYGNKWTAEQIIDATTRYVTSFDPNRMDKAMMLLKYFIMKDSTSTLLAYLEATDDIAKMEIDYGTAKSI